MKTIKRFQVTMFRQSRKYPPKIIYVGVRAGVKAGVKARVKEGVKAGVKAACYRLWTD